MHCRAICYLFDKALSFLLYGEMYICCLSVYSLKSEQFEPVHETR